MHIVVFTGGDFPAPHLAEAYVSAHKADYVIAADSGLLAFEAYNAHFCGAFGKNGAPDAILGDMDSLAAKNAADKLKAYPTGIVQTFIEDKDYTDTELALEAAHKRLSDCASGEANWITLIGAGGGQRADHFLAVFDIFSTRLRPDVWLSGDQSLWHAPHGSSFSIRGLGLRDMISLARTTASRTGGNLYSEGLFWEYGGFRKEGMPSISNRISPAYFESGKPVKIEARAGNFVLILPTKASVTRSGCERDSPAQVRLIPQGKQVNRAGKNGKGKGD